MLRALLLLLLFAVTLLLSAAPESDDHQGTAHREFESAGYKLLLRPGIRLTDAKASWPNCRSSARWVFLGR